MPCFQADGSEYKVYEVLDAVPHQPQHVLQHHAMLPPNSSYVAPLPIEPTVGTTLVSPPTTSLPPLTNPGGPGPDRLGPWQIVTIVGGLVFGAATLIVPGITIWKIWKKRVVVPRDDTKDEHGQELYTIHTISVLTYAETFTVLQFSSNITLIRWT
ncbi:hypothetical protein M409DRAFT_55269 [Zasmidium cellare ATCC 36951]|uniref:Uncharacterized protein n=1 Tax=Zasmidium cellare ATCC 36951 TaxID=1080233 RepID=A0A6A6CKF4_ZASCE|nr:uncharacterized protein M409DRAFT_55269 [Zasmidium cellare ATCC 36951]KAF2165896.1 hypothetical protein M409DRAFT_55269 [Zasmidium cellare ATCC 36951]